ncbi:MAG: hypothetical protein ABI640_01585 [Gammaproteobacteria bacterium]
MRALFHLRFLLDQLLYALSPRRNALEDLRARWGHVGTQDGWLATRYFDLTRGQSTADHVDDKTWGDLELPRVFADLDTTVTRVGSQSLFKRLRTYTDGQNELAEQYRVYEMLRADPALREAIQLKLSRLREDSNADIVNYVFGRPPEKPQYVVPILLWSLVSKH